MINNPEKALIGIDFSITKPAATIQLQNGTSYYMAWPRVDSILKSRIDLYREIGVYIIDRKDESNIETNSSKKINFTISNAQYLADLMYMHLHTFLMPDTIIAFEGLSFGSTGDAVLQLSGYKYILMDRLSKLIPLENMYTYAPITIKKVAGCSQKGLTKKDMIDSFLKKEKVISPLILDRIDKFTKKGGKNYIELLDDIVDSFWVIETYKEKELLKK